MSNHHYSYDVVQHLRNPFAQQSQSTPQPPPSTSSINIPSHYGATSGDSGVAHQNISASSRYQYAQRHGGYEGGNWNATAGSAGSGRASTDTSADVADSGRLSNNHFVNRNASAVSSSMHDTTNLGNLAYASTLNYNSTGQSAQRPDRPYSSASIGMDYGQSRYGMSNRPLSTSSDKYYEKNGAAIGESSQQYTRDYGSKSNQDITTVPDSQLRQRAIESDRSNYNLPRPTQTYPQQLTDYSAESTSRNEQSARSTAPSNRVSLSDQYSTTYSAPHLTHNSFQPINRIDSPERPTSRQNVQKIVQQAIQQQSQQQQQQTQQQTRNMDVAANNSSSQYYNAYPYQSQATSQSPTATSERDLPVNVIVKRPNTRPMSIDMDAARSLQRSELSNVFGTQTQQSTTYSPDASNVAQPTVRPPQSSQSTINTASTKPASKPKTARAKSRKSAPAQIPAEPQQPRQEPPTHPVTQAYQEPSSESNFMTVNPNQIYDSSLEHRRDLARAEAEHARLMAKKKEEEEAANQNKEPQTRTAKVATKQSDVVQTITANKSHPPTTIGTSETRPNPATLNQATARDNTTPRQATQIAQASSSEAGKDPAMIAMEEEMRAMVEKMREYQAKDPKLFQNVWESVKKTQSQKAVASPTTTSAVKATSASDKSASVNANVPATESNSSQSGAPAKASEDMDVSQNLQRSEQEATGASSAVANTPVSNRKRPLKPPGYYTKAAVAERAAAKAQKIAEKERVKDGISLPEAPHSSVLPTANSGTTPSHTIRTTIVNNHVVSETPILPPPRATVAMPALAPPSNAANRTSQISTPQHSTIATPQQPPRSSATKDITFWQIEMRPAFAKVAADHLNSTPVNVGPKIPVKTIEDLFDKNPTYAELCQMIDKLGFRTDWSQLARALLNVVSSDKTEEQSGADPASPLPVHDRHSDCPVPHRSEPVTTVITAIQESTSAHKSGQEASVNQTASAVQSRGSHVSAIDLAASSQTSPISTESIPRRKDYGTKRGPYMTKKKRLLAQAAAAAAAAANADTSHEQHMDNEDTSMSYATMDYEGHNTSFMDDDIDEDTARAVRSLAGTSQGISTTLAVQNANGTWPSTAGPVEHTTSTWQTTANQSTSAGSVNPMAGPNEPAYPQFVHYSPYLPGSTMPFVPAPSDVQTPSRPPPLHLPRSKSTKQRTKTSSLPRNKASKPDPPAPAPIVETKESAARKKRTFAEIMNLGGTAITVDSDSESDLEPVSATKTNLVSASQGPDLQRAPALSIPPTTDQPSTLVSVVPPTTHLKPIEAFVDEAVPRLNPFQFFSDITAPIKRSRALRKSRYDPTTIARDILIASARHPSERALNVHLKPLALRFAHVNHNSDLSTFRWTVVDPGGPSLNNPSRQHSQKRSKAKLRTMSVSKDNNNNMRDTNSDDESMDGPGIQILDESDMHYDDDELAADATSLLGGLPTSKKVNHQLDISETSSTSRRSKRARDEVDYNVKGKFQSILAGQASSTMPALLAPEQEKQRRKRQSRSYPEPTATYNKFKCYWTHPDECKAVLHNLDALSIHLRKVHISRITGHEACAWEACPFDEMLDKNEMAHHVATHLAEVRQAFGDGPKAVSVSSASSVAATTLNPYEQDRLDGIATRKAMNDVTAYRDMILTQEAQQPITVAGRSDYNIFDEAPYGVQFAHPLVIEDNGPYGLVPVVPGDPLNDFILMNCEIKRRQDEAKGIFLFSHPAGGPLGKPLTQPLDEGIDVILRQE